MKNLIMFVDVLPAALMGALLGLMLVGVNNAYGYEYKPVQIDKGYTIRDKDNIRRGTITRDRRNGGYTVRDRDGIRQGKIDTGNELLTSDRYNIRIEKQR